MASATAERQVIQLPVEPGLVCLRCLSPKRLRFEVEYGLERGTTANSFLFLPRNGEGEQIGSAAALLVHPPGASFAEPYLEQLAALVPSSTELQVVVSHVNPNRIALLHELARRWDKLRLIASNPGAKLLQDLWAQRKPTPAGEAEPPALPPLPPLTVVRGEDSIERPDGYTINLLSAPTPRWPGALMAFEETTGLLMSGKFFSAHLCSQDWAEANRSSTEEDRRYFYDCLMAPMARQVEAVLNRLDELSIRCIAPGHGPAIAESWRSLLVDYRRWGESQERSSLSVALLFASAYGNTAAIADALAQGVSRTGVRVESVNCEFTPAEKLLETIRSCDALLIGSPTLGGHAPTPIVSALGTVLAEGDRSKPVGVFGSFGWSGEAIDLLESKLRDGGFTFAFEPIRVKFSPDASTIKTLEETGTGLGRSLITAQRKAQRRSASSGGLSESRSNPAVLALGRVIGSLCVLTTRKGSGESQLSGAMVASWVSQASFTPPGLTVAVAKDRAVEALLHVGDSFALNVLASGRESGPMKQFLQPFAPGADRFAGLDLEESPGGQPILPDALAWLDCSVKQRMECGDHWLIYAQVGSGALLDGEATTAVHQRRSGANY
ncbi:diflavin flavoprotein [Synechococcus sp. LTW-R]|uniref:diflavin flavoprotein n=1 Tax=Synechococcus sp. LTW-R TaxID=2751170 RepID=UPI00162750C5|nr:diflavin flavoprotein [Synechococcus sp. LTW-R]QNG29285.1 flavin reductase [Synechococcus sp. LTW-R]